MPEYKYEVGDRFEDNSTPTFGPEIVVRYLGADGKPCYVLRRNSSDHIRSEAYMDTYCTKIEPFFEVGKQYRGNNSGHTFLCVYVDETLAGKQAFLRRLDYSGASPVYHFTASMENYTEVK